MLIFSKSVCGSVACSFVIHVKVYLYSYSTVLVVITAQDLINTQLHARIQKVLSEGSNFDVCLLLFFLFFWRGGGC